MSKRIAAGAGAGLVAGLIFAIVMRALPATAADGSRLSMIAWTARLIDAGSPLAGWLAYVAYAVVLGALFGAVVFAQRMSGLRAALLGGVWGLGWFVVVGLGAIPVRLGSWPFSPTALGQLGSNIGVPLLIGHIAYGLILGLGFRSILAALATPGSSGGAQPGVRRAA